MRRIGNAKDLQEGVAALVGACGHMARLHALCRRSPAPPPPGGIRGPRARDRGAAALRRQRQRDLGPARSARQPFTAASLLAVPQAEFRATGLSAGKTATLKRLAQAIDSGGSISMRWRDAPETPIHQRLTEIKGIGPWTADIYILFCLGRPDAWSPGDLALQHAVRDALELDERPSSKSMVEIAEAWRPWRAVAARLLWSYYALRRRKDQKAPDSL